MHAPRRRRFSLRASLPLCLVCLITFAVYAAAVQVMPLHDDARILERIRGVSLLEIFDVRSSGGVEYRPAGTAFWIVTRMLFGEFVPGILHMWNVFGHVLNTALVAALVRRLLSATRAPGGRTLTVVTTAALFALFPFSYQAVIAGAIYHPVMLLMGLSAVHAYLRYRATDKPHHLLLSAAFLLAACLSHEAGFVFGPLVLLTELALAWATRERPRSAAVVMAVTVLLYPIAYRLLVQSMWTPDGAGLLARDATGMFDKAMYYSQGLLWWIIAPARPFISGFELGTASRVTLATLAVLATAGGLWLAARARLGLLALFGLGWWAIALAPAIATLPLNYVTDTPRLMYVPSVGLAFFWGMALTGLVRWIRVPALRVVPMAVCVALLAWSVGYVTSRLREVARLTPAFAFAHRALLGSNPQSRALLVNAPFLVVPTQPGFLFGREGFSLWEPNPGYAPIEVWLAAIGGQGRPGTAVRHAISLTDRDPNSGEADKSFTLGRDFKYGVFGPLADDAGLRQALLDSTHVFRFDYDAPGLRLRQVANIAAREGGPAGAPTATFEREGGRFTLRAAAAVRCNQRIIARLSWQRDGGDLAPVGVFVHGYDGGGNRTLVADKDALDGVLPLAMLPDDLTITETREIGDPDTQAAVQQLRVGVYDRASGQRYAALRADGTAWEGDEVVIPITEGHADIAAMCAR